MKRLTNRKLRLAMTLKAFKNGRTITSTTYYKKTQIYRASEAISFEKGVIKCLLRVTYCQDQINESEHINKASLLDALHKYTEKKLTDFLING